MFARFHGFRRAVRTALMIGAVGCAAALTPAGHADPPVFPPPSLWPPDVPALVQPAYRPGLTPSTTTGFAPSTDSLTVLILNGLREAGRLNITVVDLVTGVELFKDSRGVIPTVAGFSPRGNIATLLQPDSTSGKARLRLIDGGTGNVLLDQKFQPTVRIGWAFDGSRLIVQDTGTNGLTTISAFGPTGAQAYTIPGLRQPTFAIDPQNLRLLVRDLPSLGRVRLQIRNLQTGAQLASFEASNIANIGFSPTGDRITFAITQTFNTVAVKLTDRDGGTIFSQNATALDQTGFSDDAAQFIISVRNANGRNVAFFRASNGDPLRSFTIVNNIPPRAPTR